MKTDVLCFIENFKKGYYEEELEDVFMNGNCYHFALILAKLFDGFIYYDLFQGRFITEIGYKYYDIKGEVDTSYYCNLTSMSSLREQEPNIYKRVINDCVYKNTDHLPSSLLF